MMRQASGEYLCLKHLATKHFHLLAPPRALIQLCLSAVYIILNESCINFKLYASKKGLWKILHHWLLLPVDEGHSAFFLA